MSFVIMPVNGEHIDLYAGRMADTAKRTNSLVAGEFNGVKLTCRPGQTAGWVSELFYAMGEILAARGPQR